MSGSAGLMTLSRRDMGELYSSMRDSKRYIESARDAGKGSKGKDLAKLGIEAAEVAAGAVGVGWIAGRLGTTSIPGTSIPLGPSLAVAGFAASYFGVLGGFAEHVQNVSVGALAGWATMWGVGHGSNARVSAGQPATPIAVGALGAPSAPVQLHAPQRRSHLSEAELHALASGMQFRRAA